MSSASAPCDVLLTCNSSTFQPHPGCLLNGLLNFMCISFINELVLHLFNTALSAPARPTGGQRPASAVQRGRERDTHRHTYTHWQTDRKTGRQWQTYIHAYVCTYYCTYCTKCYCNVFAANVMAWKLQVLHTTHCFGASFETNILLGEPERRQNEQRYLLVILRMPWFVYYFVFALLINIQFH